MRQPVAMGRIGSGCVLARLIAGSAGCGAGDAPRRAGEVTVRDSAGIRIVENPWAYAAELGTRAPDRA